VKPAAAIWETITVETTKHRISEGAQRRKRDDNASRRRDFLKRVERFYISHQGVYFDDLTVLVTIGRPRGCRVQVSDVTKPPFNFPLQTRQRRVGGGVVFERIFSGETGDAPGPA
jgi:hypothetical protein